MLLWWSPSQNDQTAPHYRTTFAATRQTVRASLAPVRLTLVKESLADLLCSSKAVLSAVMYVTGTRPLLHRT